MQKAFASAVADETPALRLLHRIIVAGAFGRAVGARSQQQEQTSVVRVLQHLQAFCINLLAPVPLATNGAS